MEKIEVVQVINTLSIGGAEKIVTTLALGLKKKCRTSVIVLGESLSSIFEKELEDVGINIYYLNSKTFFNVSTHIKIYRILASIKPQIIHTHLGGLSYVFTVAKILNISKIIHTIHSPKEGDNLRIRYFHHLAFKLGVIPVAVSNDTLKKARKKIGKFKYKIIYNGVNIKIMNRNHKTIDILRKKIGIPINKFVFINVANLHEIKRQELLIDGFSELLKLNKNCFLLIVGKGKKKNKIESQILKLNINNKCKIIDNCQDVSEYLSLSNCFVLTSKSEGLPMSILEAMVARLPVIATDVGGIREIIKKENGFLLLKPTNKKLSKLMFRLSKMNQKEIIKITNNGYETIKNNFSLNNMIKSYYQLYKLQ